MSGALIDFVEARLDAMNGVRSELRATREPAAPIAELRLANGAPAPPPITPPHRIIKRHVKKSLPESKIVTEGLHESFGWLEEYVDVKLELMQKRDSLRSLGSSTMSLGSSTRSFDTTDSPRGHRHRRSLSRRDSLDLQLKESSAKGHKRTHSRRESLLIGLYEEGKQDPIVEAALAA
jgi:hypothetical protein